MATSILLTGGTGFLGRWLAPELASGAGGARLKALVRPPLSRPAVGRLRELGFELLLGDLRELEVDELAPVLEGVELIIHLAAILEGHRRLLLQTNWRGTTRLLAAARAAGVKRIIHLSSIGASQNPKFPYAHSVWLAEQAVLESGLEFVILRSSVLVGPGDPFTSGLIHMALNWPVVILPQSGTRFQPLWVGDMARCILQFLGRGSLPNRVIELGGPLILTLDGLIDMIQAELGVNRPMIHLPRRPLRLFIKILPRLGLHPPLVPSHLIGTDNVAGPGVVEAICGFAPRSLRAALDLQEGGRS
ncbi:MAG: NAD-dependent epimerase/dehydratase family protein [Candidatus Bipolaricaulia bacterium]